MLKRESTIDEILEFFKDYEMDLKKYEYMSEEDLAEHLKNLKCVMKKLFIQVECSEARGGQPREGVVRGGLAA